MAMNAYPMKIRNEGARMNRSSLAGRTLKTALTLGIASVLALILGVVETVVATFYGPSWSPAVAFGVLLLTLAVALTAQGAAAAGPNVPLILTDNTGWGDWGAYGGGEIRGQMILRCQCNPDISTYCTPGTSSSGCVAMIGAAGIPSATLPSGGRLAQSVRLQTTCSCATSRTTPSTISASRRPMSA